MVKRPSGAEGSATEADEDEDEDEDVDEDVDEDGLLATELCSRLAGTKLCTQAEVTRRARARGRSDGEAAVDGRRAEEAVQESYSEELLRHSTAGTNGGHEP